MHSHEKIVGGQRNLWVDVGLLDIQNASRGSVSWGSHHMPMCAMRVVAKPDRKENLGPGAKEDSEGKE